MACGQNGTRIDSDTRQAFLYSVGHANGPATPIRSQGRVHGTFDDPVYFRWAPIAEYDTANGG
jgi:hypothetical protein